MFAVLLLHLLVLSINGAPGAASLRLSPALQARQVDSGNTPSSQSSWWPYHPSVVSGTPSEPVDAVLPPSTVWWTTFAPSADAALDASTATNPTASTPTDSDDDALSNSNYLGTESFSFAIVSITSPTSAEPSTSASASSALSLSKAQHPALAIYLAPILTIIGLLFGILIGLRCARRNASGTSKFEDFDYNQLEDASHHPGREALGLRYDHDTRKANGIWPSVKQIASEAFSASSSHCRRQSPVRLDDTLDWRLPGRMMTERRRAVLDDTVAVQDLDPHRMNAKYGYGQWRERSIKRHINLDLARAYANEAEGDKEEFNCTDEWRHYSSIYDGSPDVDEGLGGLKKYNSQISQRGLFISPEDKHISQIEPDQPSSPSKYKRSRSFPYSSMLPIPSLDGAPMTSTDQEASAGRRRLPALLGSGYGTTSTRTTSSSRNGSVLDHKHRRDASKGLSKLLGPRSGLSTKSSTSRQSGKGEDDYPLIGVEINARLPIIPPSAKTRSREQPRRTKGSPDESRGGSVGIDASYSRSRRVDTPPDQLSLNDAPPPGIRLR